MTFKELLFLESFDLLDKPKKLIPAKAKELLTNYLSQKYKDPTPL